MKLRKLFDTIFDQSRRHRWPMANRMVKLTEETGELAEAVNYHLGLLQHKTMKEPIEGEVADVIITALDVLRKAYEDLSDEEVLELLKVQLLLKSQKWEAVLLKHE